MNRNENGKRFPLSLNQTNILNLERVLRGTSVNNVSTTIRIQGRVDFVMLQKSISMVLESNPSLRIRLTEESGEVLQFYAPYVEEEFPVYDFSGTNEEGLENWETAATRELIPLFDSPLYRFVLFRTSETAGGIFVKIHHIITDGWSQVLLSNKIACTYLELLQGKEPQLEPMPGYDLHVKEEEEYLASKAYARDEKYWKSILQKAEEPSSLKKVNSAAVSPVGMRKSFPLPQLLNHSIYSFCLKNRVSPFAVIYMALAIYFKRNGGENCFTIGVPVFNRTKYSFKQSTGMFVTTLPFISEINDEWSLNRFNEVLAERWLEMLRHQRYPFSRIMADSGKDSRLFNIALSYQDSKVFESRDATVTFSGRWHYCGYQAEHLAIHLTNLRKQCEYSLDYDYLTQVFSEEEITALHAGLCHILAEALHEADRPIHKLNILSLDQKEQLLYRFNQTDRYLKERSLYCALAEDNAKNLNRAAIIQNGQRVSYGALFHRSSQFASAILPHAVEKENLVAIFLPRGAELIAAMVGCLEAECAYLLISETTPPERLKTILTQSGAVALITDYTKKSCVQSWDIPLIYREDVGVMPISARQFPAFEKREGSATDALAYVVYTSGSTNEPKGVEITQKNVLNLAQEMKSVYGQSAVLSLCNVGFDAFMLESIAALLNGRTVVMPVEADLESPERLATIMDEYAVGFFAITPSRLSAYLQNETFRKVMWRMESIVCGGEPFQPELLKTLKLCTHARIYNQYGPSEATVAVSMKEISEADRITIGVPMGNCKLYVLDQWMNPLPVGGIGQLFVGGQCVGRGYRNRPDLTEKAFRENPFIIGDRIYNTGDLASWTQDGEMVFMGRADRQVKLRGLRIELQEISSCIERYPGIFHAYAKICVLGGQEVLGAYYVSDGAIPEEKLLSHCATYLPQYMIPSFLMRVESLQTTANGKINEDKLPLPEADTGSSVSSSGAVRSVVAIFKEALNQPLIGENSDYFLYGGNSLNALDTIIRLERAFGKRLRVADLYACRTPLRLAALLDGGAIADSAPSMAVEQLSLEKAPVLTDYPLTPIQEGIYVQSILNPTALTYHMPGAFLLEEAPDRAKLEEAFRELIRQDPIFRTVFVHREGSLRARVLDEVSFSLQTLMGTSFEEASARFLKPFSMNSAPLLRAALWTSPEKDVYLFIDCHHIIGDGISSALVMKRLDCAYRGEKQILAWNYFDYVHTVSGASADKGNLAFWADHLKNLPEALTLPGDYPQKGKFDFKGSDLELTLSEQQSLRIHTFCKESGYSEFALFLASFSLLLSALSERNDFVLGAPVSGRNHLQSGEICGPFINTLPLRMKPRKTMTVSAWLDAVREEVTGMMDHQAISLEQIITELDLPRGEQNALYRIMITQSPVNEGEFALDGRSMQFRPLPTGSAKMDLLLEIGKKNDNFNLRLSYATSRFKEETVRFYGRCIAFIAEMLTKKTDSLLTALPLLCPEDKQRYLDDPNFLSTPFINKPVHRILKERALADPEATAVIHHDQVTTFGTLEKRASAIALFLEEKGVKPGDVVALCLKRTPDLIAAMYGILKAGASYMFLLPSFPVARLRYMLDISKATVLLYDRIPEDLLKESLACAVYPLPEGTADSYEDRAISEDALINVLFTSGSTGNPKGVMLRHRSVSNLYSQMKTLLDPIPGTVLCSTNTVFDCFIVETIIALALGRTVVLADEEEMMLPWKLARLMESYKTGVLEMTPARLQMCLSNDAFCKAATEIRIVLLGGEVVTETLRDRFYQFSSGMLMNMYGPTEATVFTTMGLIKPGEHITIGKALQNTRVYVLDEERRPVLPTACGELYIAGECLSAGYVSSPELTSARYLDDIFVPGEKMYASGDLVRLRLDGEFDYVGRKDGQVKVNGQRVELSEITNAIDRTGMVGRAEAIAFRKEDGATELFAFYVPLNDRPVEEALKEELARSLPPYMIPSHFVKMAELPETATAKIDRLALRKMAEELIFKGFVSKNADAAEIASRPIETPCEETKAPVEESPAQEVQAIPAAPAAAAAPTEEYFLAIWRRVLHTEDIATNISFFKQGGSSMAALNVLNAYYNDGYEMSLADFYENATIDKNLNLFREKYGYEALCDQPFDEPAGEVQEAPAAPAATVTEIPAEQANTPDAEKAPIVKTDKAVLVTGATGFLGIHVVHKLIESTSEPIVCMIRSGGLSRFRSYYNWYFGEEAALPEDRIQILEGDVTEERFGLSEESFEKLAGKVVEIYHCAADVRHYTAAEEVILKANVGGTEQVLQLAQRAGAVLYHMSTSSVSGETMLDGSLDTVFTENDFDIGQNWHENIYVKSKFIAEQRVLQAMENGLKAKIFRLGRLVGRASDGKFQINADSNAFFLLLKGLLMLGEIPKKAGKLTLDLMPIDVCVEEIFALRLSSDSVFHIIHPAPPSLAQVLKSLQADLKVVNDDEFSEDLRRKGHTLDQQLVALVANHWLLLRTKPSTVSVSCEKTIAGLYDEGFVFPELSIRTILKDFLKEG